MTIESQENVITCCNGKTYTRLQIVHRVYIFFLWIGLLCLQITVERITIDGMFQNQLVDIHVFICAIGGVWMLGSILAMTPKNMTQKNTGSHGILGFLSTILITAGTALLHGNTTHAYPYHSIAGFTCVIALWIQMVLGFLIFENNLTEKDNLWWAKVMHIVLGFAIVISGSLCFITGFGTAWFLVLYSFLSDPLTVFTWFSVCTALLTLLTLFIPLYKLTKEGLRYFHNSTT